MIIKKINFQTPLKFTTKDDVLDFYLKMHKDGYFKEYMKVLVVLFNKNVDVDLLFEIHEKEKDKRKTLKLYKETIESRDRNE